LLIPDRNVRLALVQRTQAFLDLDGSLELLDRYAAEAKDAGADVVAFPETWLPGYPFWLDTAPSAALWEHPPSEEIFSLFFRNAVDLTGDAAARIAEVARAHEIVLVLGLHERDGGSLYNTITIHGSDGALLSRHRKLVPTYTERLSGGAGMHAASARPRRSMVSSGRWSVGSTGCPLRGRSCISSRSSCTLRSGPGSRTCIWWRRGSMPSKGAVLSRPRGGVLRRGDLPKLEGFADVPGDDDELLLRGGSCIIAPSGEILAGPLMDEEGLVIAELDPELAIRGRMTLDVTGHYSRPDLFRLDYGGERVFG
jgi:nitrilase